MLSINPFCARRPRPGLEHGIAALPYDVLTREQAAQSAAGHPESILYVTRPEIGFPSATPVSEARLEAAARQHYRGLMAAGHLVTDPSPCYYLYEQQAGAHRQRGIVALFHVADYGQGRIRRHESTRRDKERERTGLLRAVGAQPGLVFLACRPRPELADLLAALPDRPWLYDIQASDGASHRILPLLETEKVARALAAIPAAYIADGHHRAAAAAGVAREDAGNDRDSPHAWFPAALFPADTLQVFGYHRCVRTLGDLGRDAFFTALGERFHVCPSHTEAPLTAGTIRLLMTSGCWDMRVAATPATGATAAGKLDVAVLQNHVLQPLLGIDDPRDDPNLTFVGGAGAAAEMIRRLQSGVCEAAFMMAPVSVEQMMDVADENGSMPPKSTWFEPKLLEGLLIHDREDDA